MGSMRIKALCRAWLLLGCAFIGVARAQEGSLVSGNELAKLRQELVSTQQQLAASQSEIRELRDTVEQLQKQFTTLQAAINQPPAAKSGQNVPANEEASISAEDWQLLNAKVEEHQQAKVESGSKFRLKLSGMVLLNVFGTAGNVDQIDLPTVAMPHPAAAADGNFGASLRQSVFTITGSGPTFIGAHTSADLQVDFFGGLPNTYSGYSSGLARLRLARVRFDWDRTSAIGGLDVPFFSPNSPTSYATVAEPALSNAGNLWTWTPQLRLEQRFELAKTLVKVEGGILDYAGYTGYYQDYRYAAPGESSRQPAYAARVSANGRSEDTPVAFGVSGIYAPQRYPFGNTISGWGGMLDWKTPILPRTELSGEFFIGQGLSGFGGVSFGLQQSQTYQYLAVSAYQLARLQSIGGWSQLKYRLNSRNEFNIAAGYGGVDSESLRDGSYTNTDLLLIPARNETLLMNYVLRPRSDLVFSLEYRHLKTYRVTGGPQNVDHIGLAAGYIF